MKLRTKYVLFVLILHLITLVLSYVIFKDNTVLFIVSEVFIFLSALLAWQLFTQLIQPLKTLMTGVEAIKDRDFTTKFVTTGKHEMDELILVYNQMIDVLRTERTRQEQQHFFLEKLIQTSPTGIIILDYDNKVHQLNPKAVQLLGVDENLVLNRGVENIEHPVMKIISGLQSGEAKTITLNGGGTTFKIQKSHFIDRGFPRVFIMVEELTIEILEAEKRAYGKVIRMMAHEVNNTIGPVNSILHSTLKVTQSELNQSVKLKNALEVAIERNQNLSLFMRNFADIVRLPHPNKRNIDLHTLINNITTLMAFKAGEKEIEFNLDLSDTSITLDADEQQMEQALINIVKNAVESIDSKGTITFTTRTYPSQLIITDTGKGIDPAFADNIFTPFSTTKKDGQGVGLTLVREILLNHDFKFSLETVKEGQTNFTITFNS